MVRKLKNWFLGQNKHVREMAGGTALAFAYRILGMLSTYSLTLFISRGYGAEGVGVYTVCITLVMVLYLPATLGTGSALLRFVPEHTANDRRDELTNTYRKILFLIFPVCVLFGVCTVGLSGWLGADVFKDANAEAAIRVSGWVLPCFALSLVNVEVLRGFRNLLVSEYLRNLHIPLTCAISLFFLRHSADGLTAPLISYAIAVVSAFIISVIAVQRYFPVRHFLSASTGNMNLQAILQISLPMMWGQLSTISLGYFDTLMLGWLGSSEEVGIYSVAFKISALASFLPVAISMVSAPKFSELHWDGRKEELRQIVHINSAAMFWAAIPLGIVIASTSSVLLGIFGEEFRSGQTSLYMILFGQCLNAACGFVGSFLNMTGHHKMYRNIIVVSVLVNVVLNYLWIPRYGVSGAAAASVVATLIWNVAGVIHVWRHFRICIVHIPGVTRFRP